MKKQLLFLFMPVAFATPAFAQDASTDAPHLVIENGDDVAIVPDDDLDEQRGGFVWNGVQVSLGANIKTYLNGELALQTTLNWNADGYVATQYVSGALTPLALANIQPGVRLPNNVPNLIANGSAFLANEGQTLIIQRTDGSLTNMLINTANNISAQQQIDATIDLSGMQAFQSNLASDMFANALGDSLGAATSFALRH
jgi:hypothetical protein